MAETDIQFLDKLLSLSSPTGGEQKIQRYLYDWAKPFAHKIETDPLGNLAVVINPDAKLSIMLAAHCDRIGFMVMEITSQGYLRIDPLGGVDEATILGARVIVQTQKGPVSGVIGKVSTHLQDIKDKETVPTVDTVWIDIGAKDKEDAEKYVSIGDNVTFETNIMKLLGQRISSPALDNMLGLYAIMQTAKNCAEKGIDVTLYCVSTTQEEIGSRGAKTAANAIHPDIAIAVDTTLATDTPGKTKKMTEPRLFLDKGPSIMSGPNASPVITRLLKDAAERSKTLYQMEISADEASNDANEMQLADSGSAAGSIGIPLRNMHTQVEVASLVDVEATVNLLTEFVCALKADQDLLPVNHDIDGKFQSSLIVDRLGSKKQKEESNQPH